MVLITERRIALGDERRRAGSCQLSGKPSTFSCIERLNSHTGNEKYPAVGSSGEYWSMSESSNQGFAEMRGYYNREGYGSCKVCARVSTMTSIPEENPGLTTCQQLR